jgi:hypothetical protein
MTLALKVLESRNCLKNALLAGIFLGDGRDQHCVASQYLAHNTRRFWHSRILHSDAREMIFQQTTSRNELPRAIGVVNLLQRLVASSARVVCGTRSMQRRELNDEACRER